MAENKTLLPVEEPKKVGVFGKIKSGVKKTGKWIKEHPDKAFAIGGTLVSIGISAILGLDKHVTEVAKRELISDVADAVRVKDTLDKL